MSPRFAPSLICCDPLAAARWLPLLEERADMLHLDLMDGHFVKNLGLSLAEAKFYCGRGRPADCHLMVTNPMDWLPALADAGAKRVTVHAELEEGRIFDALAFLKERGLEAGLALGPDTPIEVLRPWLSELDQVTVMTVQPGCPGAAFRWDAVERIAHLAALRRAEGLHITLEMDGSLSDENFAALKEAGTDLFVAGDAALFARDSQPAQAWEMMEKSFQV